MTLRGALVALLLVSACLAQVTISDTIRVPLGGVFEGRITITAPNQMTWQGNTYVGWEKTWTIDSTGAFLASLVPNDTALPKGTYYKVQYIPKSGKAWSENWSVASSATPLRISQVRITSVPSASLLLLLSQLSKDGATEGDCIKIVAGVPKWTSCGGGGPTTYSTWFALSGITWGGTNIYNWSQLQ